MIIRQELDLNPPENFLEQPNDLDKWLFENMSRVQRLLENPILDNVLTTPHTIPDNSSPLNMHIVHINKSGVVIVYLPSNPNPGELFFCKDGFGDAATGNKSIQVTSATGLIEGAGSAVISVNFQWFLFYGFNGNYYRIG